MEARKCDRCGQFYIDSSVGVDYTTANRLYLTKFIHTASKDQRMDLCCDCKHDLDEWFNKFKKEEQNDECKEV